MSSVSKNASRIFLSVSEQQVLVAVEALLKEFHGAFGSKTVASFPTEREKREAVQKKMRELKLKKFNLSRIGQLLTALHDKGVINNSPRIHEEVVFRSIAMKESEALAS